VKRLLIADDDGGMTSRLVQTWIRDQKAK